MTIQQLKFVITISECGSLSKAAEQLYVSQPSLSSSLRELETELGIRIFHRSGRGVTLTNDGVEFMSYARSLYHQYEAITEKYGGGGRLKKKFGVSSQHFSFATKAFVEMVKHFNTAEYEFAMRETKTRDVITDVATYKSEVGIMYLSDFNRPVLEKLLKSNDLQFEKLIDCKAYVYLWRGHPLAGCESISLKQLEDYPSLAFEQGETGSLYFAEEILSTNEYPRTIHATDRATMLNIMVGLQGFILCSGIICEELNGDDYVAVPFVPDSDTPDSIMEVGYIIKKNTVLSDTASVYIDEMKKYLASVSE